MKMLAETARPVRWIIELDYDADPDTAPEIVRDDVADHMTGAKGRAAVEGSRLVFDRSEDAFSARLRFGANLVSVEAEFCE